MPGAGESYEFSDISDGKYNSESKLTSMEGRGSGCHMGSKGVVILVLIGAALAVAVGLITFFAADGRDVICQCGSTGTGGATSSGLTEQCKQLVAGGNTEICSKCPGGTSSHATTPSGGTHMTTSAPTTNSGLDVRLPDSVIPVHYDVILQPYMYTDKPEDFTFKGSATIVVTCKEATDNVTLHAADMKIDESTVTFKGDNPGSDPTLEKQEIDKDNEFFILRLSKNMEKNKNYTISMNYTADLKAKPLKGFYLSQYQRNNKTVYLATTQFQPTDARRAFPCFDEPAIKATFAITLVRRSDLISISNMPIISNNSIWTEPDGNQYVADVYQTTPKMSTYLLAFVICDFEYTSSVTQNNVTYRAFSRPEVTESTRYALQVGVDVLTHFEAFFETKYPLPKQDMIAIPDFAAGAMENWGLITYRETAMLYDPDVSNENNKERVAIVVSHELAHQWFGDLVTPLWWDDLWLNEGFATFVEYLGVDHVHKDWNMFDNFVISDVQKVMQDDGLVTSHPVYVPVNHPDEINEIFDGISYSKGGSIIRMMRHFLGFETFRKGLVRYLQKLKYDAAFHDDLWSALEEQAKSEGKDIKVKEIMDTWTLQMNYPIVTVTRDFNELGKVHVTQARFMSDSEAVDPEKYISKFGYMWSIPITITSSKNPNFLQNDTDVHWIYKNEDNKYFDIGESNLPDPGDNSSWILANTEQNGFYRVNYQVGNWKALINQLNTNHHVIPVINRAQIINDAWSIAKPGILDIEYALSTVEYLDKEMSNIPWEAALKELSYVADMLSLTTVYGKFQQFMKEKAMKPFEHYGLDNTGASHIQTRARYIISRVACQYGIENCTAQASKLFNAWMSDHATNKVDPNLKSVVYCTGVKQGGMKEWQFVLQRLKESVIASEQALLRYALACSRQPYILNHYLHLVLEENSPIRSQDALRVIQSISGSTVGKFLTWNFYRENFDILANSFSSSFFSWSQIIQQITDGFSTEFQLNELKAFMELKKDKLGTAKRAFDQAVEKVASNIKWHEVNFPAVQEWFDKKYPSSV